MPSATKEHPALDHHCYGTLAVIQRRVQCWVCGYVRILLSVFLNHTFPHFSSLCIDHSFYTYHFSDKHICNTAFELVFPIIGWGEVLVYSSLSIIYCVGFWQYNILCSVCDTQSTTNIFCSTNIMHWHWELMTQWLIRRIQNGK